MTASRSNAMQRVLQLNDFRLLWPGQATSLLGDQFYMVAGPWLVLKMTGDPLALGTVLAVGAIPRAAIMLLGGGPTGIALATGYPQRVQRLILAAAVSQLEERLNEPSYKNQAQKENFPYFRKDEDPMQSITLKFFRHSELWAHPQVCLKGTCYLITKEHYVELFDLSDDVLLGFMKEVQVAARVLREVTGAFKINYEIHGNTNESLVLCSMQECLHSLDYTILADLFAPGFVVLI